VFRKTNMHKSQPIRRLVYVVDTKRKAKQAAPPPVSNFLSICDASDACESIVLDRAGVAKETLYSREINRGGERKGVVLEKVLDREGERKNPSSSSSLFFLSSHCNVVDENERSTCHMS
jgi:hypothetical protein